MRVILVAFSFSRGGASIAAQKFARLAQRFANVRCFCAERSNIRDLEVSCPSKFEWFVHFVKRVFSYCLLEAMHDGNPAKHSLNLFSSRNALRAISDARRSDTVLHLHWINNDTLSIWRLKGLPRGTVITLHDEWLFCGAEHCYPTDAGDKKFADGYPRRDSSVSGINWNRWVWSIKLAQLKDRHDLIFTVPSNWMRGRAKQSMILENKTIRLLPNPIETERLFPLGQTERADVRARAGIADGDIVLVVGAEKGGQNPLKGFEVFRDALPVLRRQLEKALLDRVRVVLLGGGKPAAEQYDDFSVIHLGRVNGVAGMREVYGMADCTVVPSLVESFGQIAAESLSCQTPVVAFRASGLTDIVQHESNGYLAEPYRAESLAGCLARMLRLSTAERAALGRNGREHVKANFSMSVVGAAYEDIISEAMNAKGGANSAEKGQHHYRHLQQRGDHC